MWVVRIMLDGSNLGSLFVNNKFVKLVYPMSTWYFELEDFDEKEMTLDFVEYHFLPTFGKVALARCTMSREDHLANVPRNRRTIIHR
jgi:hypothetical protein